ncbi:DNase I-like protein, partial [Coprinopsis marcescibilis]
MHQAHGPRTRRGIGGHLQVTTGLASAAHKWQDVNQILRTNKIGGIWLQETHLMNTAAETLNTQFEGKIQIFNTPDKTNPAGVAGTAVVLNCRLTRWEKVTEELIILGRALMVSLPWRDTDKMIRILSVYALNCDEEIATFWTTLRTTFTGQNPKPKPNIVLGDFNNVEEATDCLPPRPDPNTKIKELRNLKTALNIIDGWRDEHPTELAYTWKPSQSQLTQNRCSRSRIDRIYISQELYPNTCDWNIEENTIGSDHQRPVATIYDPGSAEQGEGRWGMPTDLARNKTVLREIAQSTVEILREARRCTGDQRTDTENPQSKLEAFKDVVVEKIHKIAKLRVSKTKQRIEDLRRQRDHILN